jgi:hypothetical protein
MVYMWYSYLNGFINELIVDKVNGFFVYIAFVGVGNYYYND